MAKAGFSEIIKASLQWLLSDCQLDPLPLYDQADTRDFELSADPDILSWGCVYQG
jgi:hypothetical protein